MLTKLSLRARLLCAFIAFGLLPVIALTWLNYFSLKSATTAKVSAEVMSAAEHISDVIDRNLFERYGDVQAFGLNYVVRDSSQWYQHGSDKNQISAAMNEYVKAYGFYSLTLLVDLNGKVIAVNDVDSAGNKINTQFIYNTNFSTTSWFKKAKTDDFYTSEGMLSGTVLEDFEYNSDLAKIYGDDGAAIGFTAPVKNGSGEIIGVWKNFAKFSLVEDIIGESYKDLVKNGFVGSEIVLVDNSGTVLVDHKPLKSGQKYVRNPDVVGKTNLSKSGIQPIVRAIKGEHGSDFMRSIDSGVRQLVGFAPFVGALGFKGMPWAIMVQVPTDIAFAEVNRALNRALVILVVGLLLIAALSVALVNRTVQPINSIIEQLTVSSQTVNAASGELTASSQSLSQGATEQAAAIQESVASMSEMTSMIGQTAEFARKSMDSGTKMGEKADEGSRIVELMVGSIEEIQQSNNQLQNMINIIDEISAKTAVINDIVFKTQLLAFNASIEAARAGQHGRGFAVVAEEVGSLADMSGNAAKEIQTLLDTSKSEVSSTVDITRKRVDAAQEVSKKALQIFTGITSEIKSVLSQIESIHQATSEQEQGVRQASQALTQMDKVANKNSGLSGETAHAAEELAEQSKGLDEITTTLNKIIYGEHADSQNSYH